MFRSTGSFVCSHLVNRGTVQCTYSDFFYLRKFSVRSKNFRSRAFNVLFGINSVFFVLLLFKIILILTTGKK